jgi:phosphate uptake regulator
MEARKVQRVGYSTLTVSLPRDWVQEVGLKAGDIVSLRKEDDSSLRVFPGMHADRAEVGRCIIDSDMVDRPNLLTRIITGNYILGHDSIQVISRKELSRQHLEEIRNTTQRLNGLGIVEQTMRTVTIQSFVDPTKFPIYGLVRRLHIIVASMQETAIKALVERRPELASEVTHMENEADRIYWLIVRQLLLSIRDRTVGVKIGIESPLHVAGNRVIAKSLESMADHAEEMALEAIAIKGEKYEISPSVLDGIEKLSSSVRSIAEKTIKALVTLDIKLANDTVEMDESTEKESRKLIERILASVRNVPVAVALRHVVSSLGEMASNCGIISEVTINRVLEKPGEIVRYEKT